jgi:uncharacterized alkaline shock family protein YloU
VADRAVQKVATAAVDEVELAAGAPRLLGSSQRRNPRTQVNIDGRMATISVDMSIIYPSPIRTVAAVARRHVTARVHELTGLEVKHVDINVVGFPAATGGTRRVQ